MQPPFTDVAHGAVSNHQLHETVPQYSVSPAASTAALLAGAVDMHSVIERNLELEAQVAQLEERLKAERQSGSRSHHTPCNQNTVAHELQAAYKTVPTAELSRQCDLEVVDNDMQQQHATQGNEPQQAASVDAAECGPKVWLPVPHNPQQLDAADSSKMIQAVAGPAVTRVPDSQVKASEDMWPPTPGEATLGLAKPLCHVAEADDTLVDPLAAASHAVPSAPSISQSDERNSWF